MPGALLVLRTCGLSVLPRVCLLTPPGLPRAALPVWVSGQLASPLTPPPALLDPVSPSLPPFQMPLRVQNAPYSCRPQWFSFASDPRPACLVQTPRVPHRARGFCVRGQSLLRKPSHSPPCPCVTPSLNVSSREWWGVNPRQRTGQQEARSRVWGGGQEVCGPNLRVLAPSIHPWGMLFSPPLWLSCNHPPASGRTSSPFPTHPAIHPSLRSLSFSALHEGSLRPSVTRPHATSVGSSL